MNTRACKRRATLAALGALGALTAAAPVLAQFPTSTGQTGGTRTETRRGKVIYVKVKTSYLLFSPYLTDVPV